MEYDTPFDHLPIKDNILIASYRKNLIINLDVTQEIVRLTLLLADSWETFC